MIITSRYGKVSEFRSVLKALNGLCALNKEIVRFEQFNKIPGNLKLRFDEKLSERFAN
jgi:hypothetical protein